MVSMLLFLLQLPAWPFVSASVFLGAYALIPYMCLWVPEDPPQQLPPAEEELVRGGIRGGDLGKQGGDLGKGGGGLR